MNPTSILAGILVVAFAAAGSAKLAAVPSMRARAEHVGFSVAAYRRIGLLVTLEIEGRHTDPALDRALPDRCSHRPSVPAELPGASDANGDELHDAPRDCD